MEKLGCRLTGLYYSMGDYDGVVHLEAPDDTTAMAGIISAITPGHLKATKTTRLYTPAEATEAMRKADNVSYAAPAPSGG
jgi:uncharacterized protein with GYD domain